jgi:hypothetical protein
MINKFKILLVKILNIDKNFSKEFIDRIDVVCMYCCVSFNGFSCCVRDR